MSLIQWNVQGLTYKLTLVMPFKSAVCPFTFYQNYTGDGTLDTAAVTESAIAAVIIPKLRDVLSDWTQLVTNHCFNSHPTNNARTVSTGTSIYGTHSSPHFPIPVSTYFTRHGTTPGRRGFSRVMIGPAPMIFWNGLTDGKCDYTNADLVAFAGAMLQNVNLPSGDVLKPCLLHTSLGGTTEDVVDVTVGRWLAWDNRTRDILISTNGGYHY